MLVLRVLDPVAGVKAKDREEPYAEDEKSDCLGERDGLDEQKLCQIRHA